MKEFILKHTYLARAALLGILMACNPLNAAGHPDIRFPAGSGVIDVTKPPYSAKGDGVTDDTAAINAALRDHNAGAGIPDLFMSWTIYLPEGTYLVSDTLEPKDPFDRKKNQSAVRLVGEGRDKTVIRLKDNAEKFQNPARRRYILRTGNRDGKQPNAGYGNYIQHLTVDAGVGNPGAVGVRFDVANSGAMDNVRITSSDPEKAGRQGLAFEGTCGLGYVKNVVIEGFDVGIYFDAASVNNIALENIHLSNQREVGILNLSKSIQLLGLVSHNRVPAIRMVNPMAAVFLLNAHLTGVGPDSQEAAIVRDQADSFLYLRDVTVERYDRVVKSTGTVAKPDPIGVEVKEWWSADAPFMTGESPGSLRLPISEAPEYFNADLSQWANVEDFGATKDDDSDDDAPGIQAAIDSGKPIIYFPRGVYSLKSDVHIRGAVRKIDFLFSKVDYPIGDAAAPISEHDQVKLSIQGSPGFIVGEIEHEAVIFENISQFVPIVHNSSKQVVVRNRGGSHRGVITTGDAASGDLFVENAGPHLTIRVRNGIHAWLRAVNREKSGLLNEGSIVWSFADNIETMRTRTGVTTIRPIKTTGGGKTEVIGACMDALQVPHVPEDGALFEIGDSTVSITCVGEIRIRDGVQGSWPILIRETTGEETRTIPESEALFFSDEGKEWPKRFVIPMYRSPAVEKGKETPGL